MASKKKKAKQTSIQHCPVSIKYPSADKAPLLSIGMIFKNEERCLERSLQALAPLRAAIPCELVMADTGSTDNSRAIAAKYADILFDFPWINDFSAARNAVMERCSGKWFLTVDADEYLDADFSQLVEFLTTTRSNPYDFATVAQRNYTTADMAQDSYKDYLAMRMLRMSTGLRYSGRIHESWYMNDRSKLIELPRVVLHHDGYVGDAAANNKKSRRNLPLLELELQENPGNVRLALLCLRDTYTQELFLKYAHLLTELIETHSDGWELFGPPALRDMITRGINSSLPETGKWIHLAETTFPDSPFVYADIAFHSAVYYKNLDEPANCLQKLAQYQKGLSRWEKDDFRKIANVLSGLNCTDAFYQKQAHILAAECHAKLAQWEDVLSCLGKLQTFKDTDTLPSLDLITDILQLWQKSNTDSTPLLRLLHTLDLGNDLNHAVSFLSESNSASAVNHLEQIEHWADMPAFLLEHLLTKEIPLPERFYQLSSDEMAHLAKHTVSALTEQKDLLVSVCTRAAEPDPYTENIWLYHLTTATLQTFSLDDTQLASIHTAFLKRTAVYLETFYQPEILTEAHIHLLPQNIRFSWYLLQAQIHLENRVIADCVHCLRAGLKIAPHMKSLIQYLLEKVPKETPKQDAVSAELMMLAEKIRSILSAFPPDDPSVLALKASPVYQQVAHIIEQPDPKTLH